MLSLDCLYVQVCTTENTRSLANAVLQKVLTQRVDWVAWTNIRLEGARDASDDACTTASGKCTITRWSSRRETTVHHTC